MYLPTTTSVARASRAILIVVAREGSDVVLCQLSSRSHEDRPDGDEWIELGSGAWDESGRVSYVDCSRLIRAAADSIRREGAILERDRFDVVVAAVASRQNRA